MQLILYKNKTNKGSWDFKDIFVSYIISVAFIFYTYLLRRNCKLNLQKREHKIVELLFKAKHTIEITGKLSYS